MSAFALTVDNGSLRCNGLVNPLGLNDGHPRLSWFLGSGVKNDKQSRFRVQASTDKSFNQIDLWDSGQINSEDFSVTYAGSSPGSDQRTYWRVRVADATGKETSWSDPAWFEVALQEHDWKAKWITNDQYVANKTSLPVFARAFSLTCAPGWARLHYIGLGMQWAAINGHPVTNEVLQPSYSTMNKTLFFSSYDVTGMLKTGSNVLVVELGKGVHTADNGLGGRYTKFTAVGAPLPLKLIAQLEVDCTDGQKFTVVSDETWVTTTEGPLLEASWYGGEEYDARKEIDSEYLPEGDRSGWQQANLTEAPLAELHPRLQSANLPPMEVVEEFPCVEITRTKIGWVLDFGQKLLVGIVSDSAVNVGNALNSGPLRGSDQSTTGSPIFNGYTFAGNSAETHTIRFNYHGFRYLEVFGLRQKPEAQDFTAPRIRVNPGKVGSTETNVALLNNIHRMADQSIQNQMYSVMTDCPHREKLGWLEELHIAIDPVFFGYDFRAYGRHLMKQIVDAQNEEGNVPTTAPQLTAFADLEKYTGLHQDILKAFNKAYRNQIGSIVTYGPGTQAADAIPLDIGAVSAEDEEAVYRHLIGSIRDNGTHWTVGEVGLGPLFRVLTLPHGYDYLLNELMAKTDYPSYGYFLEQGATTLPEHWEGYDGTGSLDHIIFDYGDTWIYGLAGMKQSQDSVGWRSIDFEPVCVDNVTFASTEYISVRGRVAAKWERDEEVFTYNITVPVGSTGSVALSAPLRSIKLDGDDVEGQLGVHHAEQIGGKTMVTIGSGTYFFSIPRKAMSFCGI
ncbi:Alpha-L-rhamnosidase [Pseudocercospora fuligena]|uniref:alpha-L-rhamnosidase n=1 Tax=Pseudocercospora fuligena TaxID=685502 RepID=A0A8H6RKG2_9PEZI|nr:Alpha-L-rhamnosidase [Pseudocercospora fuligena]